MKNKDTFQLHKMGFDQSKLVEMDDEKKQKLKSVLLEMLVDFIDFAEKNDIKYILGGGSALGAVRHHGFIPWDDDIDINVTRKDFKKMMTVFQKELGEKYILCCPELTKGHGMLMSQIKKKGTICKSFNELSKEDEQCGICLDLFVMENVYDNPIMRRIQGFLSLAFGYLTSSRKTWLDLPCLMQYLNPDSPAALSFRKKAKLGRILIGIKLDGLTKFSNKIYKMCKDDKSKYVTFPSGRRHFWGEMQLRSDLCERKEALFENIKVYIPSNEKAYFTSLYGPDYMTPPLEQKRETHPIMELDFGND